MQVTKSSENGMPIGQAQKIALAILRYEATRQELSYSPTEDRWAKRARRWGVKPQELHRFLLQVRVPIVAEETAGIYIKVVYRGGEDVMNEKDILRVALEIVQGRGVDMSVDEFEERFQRLVKGVPDFTAMDLWNFHVQYVFPDNLQRLAQLVGAPPLAIIISDEPKSLKSATADEELQQRRQEEAVLGTGTHS